MAVASLVLCMLPTHRKSLYKSQSWSGRPSFDHTARTLMSAQARLGSCCSRRHHGRRRGAARDVVVGVDGSQSQTRRLVWGVEQEQKAVHSLGVYGAFFSIPREVHDTKWRKWFHTTRGRAIMLRPDDLGERCTVFMTVMNDTDARLPDAGKEHDHTEASKPLMRAYFSCAAWPTPRTFTTTRWCRSRWTPGAPAAWSSPGDAG